MDTTALAAQLEAWQVEISAHPPSQIRQRFQQVIVDHHADFDKVLDRLSECAPTKSAAAFKRWAAASTESSKSTGDRHSQNNEFAIILGVWMLERGYPLLGNSEPAPRSGRKRPRSAAPEEVVPSASEQESPVFASEATLRKAVASVPGVSYHGWRGIGFATRDAALEFARHLMVASTTSGALEHDPSSDDLPWKLTGPINPHLTVSRVVQASGVPAHWGPRPILATAPPAFCKIVTRHGVAPKITRVTPKLTVGAFQQYVLSRFGDGCGWIVPIYIDIALDGSKNRLRDFFFWNIYEDRITPLQFACCIVDEHSLPPAFARPVADDMLVQLQAFSNSLTPNPLTILHGMQLSATHFQHPLRAAGQQMYVYDCFGQRRGEATPRYSNQSILAGPAATPHHVTGLPWTPKCSPFRLIDAWLKAQPLQGAENATNPPTKYPILADVMLASDAATHIRLRHIVQVDLAEFLVANENPLVSLASGLVEGRKDAHFTAIFTSLQLSVNCLVRAIASCRQDVILKCSTLASDASLPLGELSVAPLSNVTIVSEESTRAAASVAPDAHTYTHPSWWPGAVTATRDVQEKAVPAMTPPIMPRSSITAAFPIIPA